MMATTVAAPIVVVLTGPSGVGKDAVVDQLIESGFPLVRPATMTTRGPRPGEVDGEHHYFVDREGFLRNVASGELLEHAEVYGNLYGVPKRSVRAALATGRHVIVRVDVQGAQSLVSVLRGALFVSLEPESLEVLRRHLVDRGTESAEVIERRLAVAADEIARARLFCTPVVNVEGNLEATVAAVRALIEREAARPDRKPLAL